MDKKCIKFAIFFMVLVVVIVVAAVKTQSGQAFSLEGKWKSIDSSSEGISCDSEITADEKYCNLNGSKEMYTLKKGENGYMLETTNPNTGKTTTFDVTVYDNEHIAVKQGSQVFRLQRVAFVGEGTCTVQKTEFQRNKSIQSIDKEEK